MSRRHSTFILTAELDPASFSWLNDLRRQHFPPERNLLPAHLTLFHRLSSAQTDCLQDFRLPDEPLPILFDAPLLLGFGVAVRVRSPELEAVRSAARSALGGGFSSQDSQSWRPHVTIQNKVAGETARQLYGRMRIRFEFRAGTVTGLLIWEYLGGPWRQAERLPFK
jgi:hypothetical protein